MHMKKFLLTVMAVIGLGTSATAQTPAELAGKYYGDLYVSLGTPIDEAGKDGGDPAIVTHYQSIELAAATAEGCIDFALHNFTFAGIPVGDILLPAIGISNSGEQTVFAENAPADLSLAGGEIKAKANIEHTTSYIKGDSIYTDVNVVWVMDGMPDTPIYVRFIGAKPAADQVFNGHFNITWTECTPWDSKNPDGFQWPDDKKGIYIQPEGWTISNVSGINGLGATLVGACDTIDAEYPDYAVTLTNAPNPFAKTQIVPAYLTLGTSWATANGLSVLGGNYSSADGGSFGGVKFTALPDALTLRYKRSHGEANATERASVIAYLWKGTYSQADVTGNTYLGGSGTTCTMVDRDRNILGMETNIGGEVTKSDDAACIARLESYIEGDAAEWTELTAEFNYGEFDGTGTLPEKMNIILSANDYFGDRSKIGDGNSLTVDDVRLVYYSTLKALAYEGEELDFSADKTSYDLSGVVYDAGKLSFAKKGQGATVTTSYNEATAQLVVRVDGADIATNPANSTAYVVQFKAGSTGIAGIEAENGSRNAVYSISGVRVASKFTDDLPKGVYIVGGKKVVKK